MQTRMQSKQSSRPTQRLRADDLPAALRQVRGIFGDDALIVATREVMVRGDDGLAPRKQVEVEVADPADTPAPSDPFTQSYRDTSSQSSGALPESTSTDSARTEPEALHSRLRRMEELSARVEGWTHDLDRGPDSADPYPLSMQLRASGCTALTIDQLSESFAIANRGGEATPSAARRHLSKYLRATSALRFEQAEGEHWFLGRAGVGKTSLVLQLAGELRRAAKEVAIVSFAPQHDGDLRRLEMASQALGVPSMVVFDAEEMRQARSELGSIDVLLVDTPCYLSHELTLDIPEVAQRHFVVPLSEDRAVLRDQLRGARGFEPDTIAVTQMDLYPRPGRLVDIAVELGRPVSFLQGRSDGALRLRLARGESLLEASLGEATTSAPPVDTQSAGQRTSP
jgi:flagellar biosynthesis GTPase FlhF